MQEIDSFKFLDFVTRKILHAWIDAEAPVRIPWTPVAKPLEESVVALISSGAIALKADRPFDQDGERRNPWWGDPTHRAIPREARNGDVEFYHLHVDNSFAREDLNCMLPLDPLESLVAAGEVGSPAGRHYSFMGYQIDPTTLLEETTPRIIEGLREDGVDLVLLVPT